MNRQITPPIWAGMNRHKRKTRITPQNSMRVLRRISESTPGPSRSMSGISQARRVSHCARSHVIASADSAKALTRMPLRVHTNASLATVKKTHIPSLEETAQRQGTGREVVGTIVHFATQMPRR